MFKTLDEIECRGRCVLVRGDLNVPMQNGVVTDSTRLDRFAPTVRELSDKGARVAVISHLGRPKGEAKPELSLRQIADALSTALGGRAVVFADDCIGDAAKNAIDNLPDGGIVLLENLRFHAGEEANDPTFVAALAENADLFVNNGFSVSHRAHASTAGIAGALPAYAGRGMQAELEALAAALEVPKKPVAALVGGAKVSTKLSVLGHLLDKVDSLIIGGGMPIRSLRTWHQYWCKPLQDWPIRRVKSWRVPMRPDAKSCCRATLSSPPDWKKASPPRLCRLPPSRRIG